MLSWAAASIVREICPTKFCPCARQLTCVCRARKLSKQPNPTQALSYRWRAQAEILRHSITSRISLRYTHLVKMAAALIASPLAAFKVGGAGCQSMSACYCFFATSGRIVTRRLPARRSPPPARATSRSRAPRSSSTVILPNSGPQNHPTRSALECGRLVLSPGPAGAMWVSAGGATVGPGCCFLAARPSPPAGKRNRCRRLSPRSGSAASGLPSCCHERRSG